VKLRDYQERAVRDLRAQYHAGRRSPICVLPTGAGKTVVAAEVARLALAKQNNVGFLVPRIELLNQAVAKLAAAGITDVRTIQAQNDNGAGSRVFVASIQTLTTERWMQALPPADLLIVDEAHHAKARTHEQLLKGYPNAKLLGLSATPQRGDGRALGDVFDSLVVGTTVKALIEQGSLVPCKVYAPPRILSSRELAQEPADAYQQRTPGQKAIVFCSTVEHAKRTADAFNALGISSRWVSGESRDREEIIEGFARRDFDILVNVSVLVEGFDDPAIEVAILAKRFTHVGSYLQALGRILRPAEGKTKATAIDLCGSALVHGTPDLEREYSLEGKGISSKREAIRQCQECGGVFGQERACPYCGFELPALERAQAKSIGVGVEEVSEKTQRTSWPMCAKRRGTCTICKGLIEVGTWIVYSKATYTAKHVGCAARKMAA
jgi:DNA repair protein RadD